MQIIISYLVKILKVTYMKGLIIWIKDIFYILRLINLRSFNDYDSLQEADISNPRGSLANREDHKLKRQGIWIHVRTSHAHEVIIVAVARGEGKRVWKPRQVEKPPCGISNSFCPGPAHASGQLSGSNVVKKIFLK